MPDYCAPGCQPNVANELAVRAEPTTGTGGGGSGGGGIEVDQYDTSGFPVCFEEEGVVTQWHTYERVRFNNTTSTETSRQRRWFNPVTLQDTATQPSGTVVTCAAEEEEEAAWTAANAATTFVAATGAGSTAAGLAAVTVTNVGAANGTVSGTPILPGETVSFAAYSDPVARTFVRVPSITYNGTGTTLHVATMS